MRPLRLKLGLLGADEWEVVDMSSQYIRQLLIGFSPGRFMAAAAGLSVMLILTGSPEAEPGPTGPSY